MKKIVPLFSYVFHPIFIPMAACLYYFFLSDSYFRFGDFEKYLFLFQVLIITIFIPIAFFYLLLSIGKIESIMVADLSQRKWPLIVQSLLFLILIKNGNSVSHYTEIYYFFLSGLVGTLLLLILIFFKIKASIHLMGMSSLLFFSIGLSCHYQINSINNIAFLVLMTGFVASSRLYLKAHTYKELIWGFCFGMISQVGFWYFWV